MFMLIVCVLSFWLVFDRSYKVLWFKVQQVFNVLPKYTDSTSQSLTFGSASISSADSGSEDGFLYKFYSEYSISSLRIYEIVRIIFCVTCSCYVIAIEIVLWQIKVADSGEQTSVLTSVLWPVVLSLLSVSLILVQPFLILTFLLNKFFGDKMGVNKLVATSVFSTIIWLGLLHFLAVGPFNYTSNLLTKLSVVGVTVMGILSGLASISTPYYVVQYLLNRNDKDSRYAAHSKVTNLLYNENVIRDKIREYETCINKDISALNGADISKQERLREGIAWYQLELVKLNGKLHESREFRMLKQMFQLVFLVYCVYKLTSIWFVSVPRLILHFINYPTDYSYEYFDNDSKKKDPLAISLANMLDFFLFRFQHQTDLDSLVKQISLLLSISLFICSLSTVTTTISYLLTLLPVKLQILALRTMQNSEAPSSLPKTTKDMYDKKKPPSIIKNLAVCELTGIYILATILLIRSNLPYDVSSKVNQLLGERFTIPNVIIDVWSDKMFAWSSMLTFIGIIVADRTLYK